MRFPTLLQERPSLARLLNPVKAGKLVTMLHHSSEIIYPGRGSLVPVRGDDGRVLHWRDRMEPSFRFSPAMIAMAQISNEGWIDTVEGEILDYWAANVALTFVGSHIGLYTTVPTADAGTGGVEVSGNAYARDPLARNTTNWPAAATGAPSSIDNGIAVTFATASGGNWGTINGWGHFDALAAGNLGAFATLDTAKAVNDGDTAEFAAGGLVHRLGDPGDTYP